MKVCVIGDTRRGKTRWIDAARLSVPIGMAQTQEPTMGVEVKPIALSVGALHPVLKLWDCAGKYTGPTPGAYYLCANSAIIFANTKAEADKWIQLFHQVSPLVHIVVCNRLAEEDGEGMIAWSDAQILAYPLRTLRLLGYF